jgi:hypothetical protein
MFLPRLTPKESSYAYRYNSYSLKELKQLKKLRKCIIYVSCLLFGNNNLNLSENDIDALKKRLDFLHFQYAMLSHRYYPKKTTRRNRVVLEKARTIESFSESNCWKRFRTRKDDLYKCLEAFKLNLPRGQYFRSFDKALVEFRKIVCRTTSRLSSAATL